MLATCMLNLKNDGIFEKYVLSVSAAEFRVIDKLINQNLEIEIYE